MRAWILLAKARSGVISSGVMGRMMKSVMLVVVATLAIVVVAAGAWAAEAQKYRVIWYSSYKCPKPVDKTVPGATPEHPLAVDGFDEPIQDEIDVSTQADEQKKARATSRFECKWVRLSGFFTPTNYYHYRGGLVASAWTHYGRGFDTPRYVVENFNDPAMRRSAIGHRQVAVVGQFYYLCLTAPRGDDIMFLFGPCHYGGVNGMMLANVRIEKIEDDGPRYLLGEMNRSIIGKMPVVVGEERTAMIESVRNWAALVQRGPKAYAREVIDRNPDWEKKSKRERAEAHMRITSPDSYVSHLDGLPAFRTLDLPRAQIAAFWAGADEGDYAVGCICMKASCTEDWPLTVSDAESFYGHAACTTIEKRDSVWTWQ